MIIFSRIYLSTIVISYNFVTIFVSVKYYFMIKHSEYEAALKIVNEYKSQLNFRLQKVKKEISSISKFRDVHKDMKIDETDCSVRLLMALSAAGIRPSQTTVMELSKIPISTLGKLRNVGKGTLMEIKEICFYAGLDLLP